MFGIMGECQTKVIAHMGASQEAPENTISAFQKALELKTDVIEFDVRVSKDGIPIVIHDSSLGWDKVIPESYLIKNLTLKEIKGYDIGKWFSKEFKGETVPTLEEVLALGGSYMVEIKWAGEPFEPYVDQILSYIENVDCVIACMAPSVVEYVKKKGHKTVGIVQTTSSLEPHVALRPDILALRNQLINKKLIEKLHDLGIEVWGWTIDDLETGKKFEKMGLDGIITNNVRGFKACF